MDFQFDLSMNNKRDLAELSFTLTFSYDRGMWKYCLWANSEMRFSITDDRGYYDCHILPNDSIEYRMDIIRLLKFLKNDKTFYNKELIQANLSRTLSIDEYVRLFYKNYSLISDFLKNFNIAKYNSYDSFDFNYDDI